MTAKAVKLLVVRVVVTFIEAGVAQAAVSGWDFSNKTVVAGVVGAGVSAVYNLLRRQYPAAFTFGVSK